MASSNMNGAVRCGVAIASCVHDSDTPRDKFVTESPSETLITNNHRAWSRYELFFSTTYALEKTLGAFATAGREHRRLLQRLPFTNSKEPLCEDKRHIVKKKLKQVKIVTRDKLERYA
jgi:hypothetical protein